MSKELTNRDLSALSFYARVLAEAERTDNPLLERANFLGIASSGLEEFRRLRLSGLSGSVEEEALSRLAALERQLTALAQTLIEALAEKKICVTTLDALPEAERERLCERFTQVVQPDMRPVEPENIPGQTLTFARLEEGDVSFALLPEDHSRLMRVEDDSARLVPVEQVAASVMDVWPLIVLRDEADADAAQDGDVRRAVEKCLKKRRQGRVTRVLVDQNMDPGMAALVCEKLECPAQAVARHPGVFDPGGIMKEVAALPGYESLRFPAMRPVDDLPEDVFAAVREKDRLLIHPYDSFDALRRWLEQAARDDAVEAIFMTLYRVANRSAVAAALAEAAHRGKRVTVLVELRARGDEAHNLYIADGLKVAGCKVLTGPPGRKVHAKALLILRRENGDIRRYAHLGTGNYNESTAAHYTDIGLMTAREDITRDAADFFQAMEHGKTAADMRVLTAAPDAMRAELLRLIRREMAHADDGRPCGMLIKLNALTDKRLIAALQEAEEHGVPISLIVRGACRLQPKADGGGITVRSLVGRFLEHGRAFRFVNGGEPEWYIASADWMGRNLDRRSELMIPIRDEAAKAKLAHYLEQQLKDTSRAWQLHVDDYTAARCCADERFDSQAEYLLERNCLR